jgi:hypothetical protein
VAASHDSCSVNIKGIVDLRHLTNIIQFSLVVGDYTVSDDHVLFIVLSIHQLTDDMMRCPTIVPLVPGILGSYLQTIPSCSEYIDSNAAETTDDGQTLSKTEIGQQQWLDFSLEICLVDLGLQMDKR